MTSTDRSVAARAAALARPSLQPGQRARRRGPLRAVGEVAALIAIAAVVIGGSNGAAHDQVPPARALDAPAFVLLALLAATVLLRRRAPLVMLLATSLLLGLFFAAGWAGWPAGCR